MFFETEKNNIELRCGFYIKKVHLLLHTRKRKYTKSTIRIPRANRQIERIDKRTIDKVNFLTRLSEFNKEKYFKFLNILYYINML